VSLLRRELEDLGARHLRAGHAGVRFRGDLGVAYRVCLWSRLAGRILLPLKSFPCADEAALYAGVKGIPWGDHLGPGGTLAVDFTSTRSALHHSRFGAQRVKDAVVDQLRERSGERPSVDRERPSVRINAHLDRDVATIAVDLSGTGLHRRGYRRRGGPAPLKENVAAAMLLHGGWPALARAGKPLVDPMCGAGTLVIEGALMAGDVAPGLTRDYFGFLGWRGHDGELWQTLLREAEDRRREGLVRLPAIAGFDADAGAVERALDNLEGAGLQDRVTIEHRGVDGLASPWPDETGLLVCNPPYGERLGHRDDMARLYTAIGETLREGFPGWEAAVLAAAPTIGSYLGLRPGASERLDNGPLPCRLTRYEIPAAGVAPRGHDSVARTGKSRGDDPNAPMFANRLRKNRRQIGAWARRRGIDCYRLYDADMPEYAFAIDVYGAEDTWVVAQEYQAPATIPEERAAARRGTVLATVADLLEVPDARIVLKTRRRQRGGDQYERVADRGRTHEVREHGARLLVNFDDRLDTGLFLDHRPVRELIRELAAGGRFLNLFAYTGAATVQAAMGGAVATTSVDISRRYLEWARDNLALNGFTGAEHAQVRADCLKWLADGPTGAGDYDVVLMDVPTFSNSTGMDDTLDVQRDHAVLIRHATRFLAPQGVLIFSNHLKRFRMDSAALERAGMELEDITRDTIPRDFARNPRAHHCWCIRRL
jgi:23S rRNA (guanine2445-N2)-methyltransferase / 23S rRNA (guanine2069-N7)-methyltransferase